MHDWRPRFSLLHPFWYDRLLVSECGCWAVGWDLKGIRVGLRRPAKIGWAIDIGPLYFSWIPRPRGWHRSAIGD